MKLLERTTVALVVLLIIAFGACTPASPDYISDYDVVYTNYEKSYNFSAVNTYFLPDSVVHNLTGGGTADHKFDEAILTQLETSLNALGWTRLPTNSGSTKADIVVLPTVSEQMYGSCAAYCWYCDWGWYPGWGYYPPTWGPGWGWGYPPDIICSSYNTGTLVVAFTDPNIAANNELPVAWIGILNGLLEGSDANISARITKNIQQMFVQSPYLKN
ncbi:DUF4136 domain-containing protein [Pollutibacter soli]|uniref:DUF4136 domain-containing protein n=1 Tax=Pollutibacter soli TaxID=3034157 RepID=UPI0030134758